jgi:hypothetical protein
MRARARPSWNFVISCPLSTADAQERGLRAITGRKKCVKRVASRERELSQNSGSRADQLSRDHGRLARRSKLYDRLASRSEARRSIIRARRAIFSRGLNGKPGFQVLRPLGSDDASSI